MWIRSAAAGRSRPVIEFSWRGAWSAGDAVLPHERPGGRVDGGHPVVVIVVDHEDAARQQFGERGMVEHPGPGRRMVALENLALAVELRELTR